MFQQAYHIAYTEHTYYLFFLSQLEDSFPCAAVWNGPLDLNKEVACLCLKNAKFQPKLLYVDHLVFPMSWDMLIPT